MKLSYRDKVILLTFSIILILAVGIFVFIKPLKEDIKVETTKRNTAQSEKNKVDDKLKEIPNMKESILSIHEEVSAIAKQYSASKEDFELDQYIQAKLNDSKVFVNESLLLNEAQLTNITYYYYTPTVLQYSLKTYADLNGKYASNDKKLTAKSDYLAQKKPETIPVMRIAFDFFCANRDYLYAFIDDMSDEDGRVIISSLSLLDQKQVISNIEAAAGEGFVVPPALAAEATQGSVSIDMYMLQAVDELEGVTAEASN